MRTLGPAMLTVPSALPCGPAADGGGDRGDAGLGFVHRKSVAASRRRLELAQKRVDRSHHVGAVAIGLRKATVGLDAFDLHGSRPKRGEPRLAARGHRQRHRVGRQRRLVDEPARRALRVRDPYQRMPVDDGEPRELARIRARGDRAAAGRRRGCRSRRRTSARAWRDASSADRSSSRGPARPSRARTASPAADARRSWAGRARSAISPSGTRARILGEELDDREAAFGGYVGHGVERAYRQRGACDGTRKAISASA